MENYDKINVISKGSFGIVYLCRNMNDDNRVVLKEIPFCSTRSDEVDAVKNEVNLLSSLVHPNIIKYYDSFFENNAVYIVTEYARRGNLHDFLVKRNNVLLPQEVVISMLCQLIAAVEYIHSKSILHRDLKAQNVLLTGHDKYIIKICDFGISKVLETRNSTSSVVGTISYMSPELCHGRSYNTSSDLWSLGCILFYMMTLQLPFISDSLVGITQQIINSTPDFGKIDPSYYDEQLIEVVYNLLDKDPLERPSISLLKQNPLLLKYMIFLGADLHSLSTSEYMEDE